MFIYHCTYLRPGVPPSTSGLFFILFLTLKKIDVWSILLINEFSSLKIEMVKKPIIKIDNVWKKYDMGKADPLVVLRKINLEINKGEFPPRPSLLCKYCDFKSICEFRKS